MRTLYFCPVVSIFLLFPHLISVAGVRASQIGCLPYFYTWP